MRGGLIAQVLLDLLPELAAHYWLVLPRMAFLLVTDFAEVDRVRQHLVQSPARKLPATRADTVLDDIKWRRVKAGMIAAVSLRRINSMPDSRSRSNSGSDEIFSRHSLANERREDFGYAWNAAMSSFLLFATGALFPVAPFFFLSGTTAVLASILISSAVLFLIGAGVTLFTGRSVLFSGIRQLLVGLAAAGVTYTLGHFIGGALSS